MKPDPNQAQTVPGLDPVAAERWLQRPATHSAWLHEEVARRMAGRLDWFRDLPTSWLDWEPVHGGLLAHRALCERLPQACRHVAARQSALALSGTAEPARRGWNPARWRRGAVPDLAGPDTRVDMVWANMALHQVAQPEQLLRLWHGWVKDNGFLMFSCFGPDTLAELRAVYAAEGWALPHHPYTDMHDWGDMLVAGGYAEPVMDMERIQLSYSSAETLLADLRELGRNLSAQRHPSLRSRAWRRRLTDALEARLPRDADGRLLLGFEIIYGHAFKAMPRAPKTSTQSVSVEAMRDMLRGSRT